MPAASEAAGRAGPAIATSVHVLAPLNRDAVGTGRIEAAGKIGRIAVFAGHRSRGTRGPHLHAQVQTVPCHAKIGFARKGEAFDEAGIPHVRMSLVLE